jgi:hypothetical protein
MYGGDDVVRASDSADVVDGGEGVDSVWAHGGTDRCNAVEKAHGCEELGTGP